ncbi:MAG: hypothetical protein LH474_05355 [Chamaesiphon sp.]|nr:hypothetical protein [Chamaesiphon sp.]
MTIWVGFFFRSGLWVDRSAWGFWDRSLLDRSITRIFLLDKAQPIRQNSPVLTHARSLER